MVRKILLLCAAMCTAQASGQSLEDRVDDLFAAWDRPDSPGAVIVISRGDSVFYARGYGAAQLDYGVPITPRTVFMVASVSKQFTAYSIALLALQGKVDLDAPVRRYVPELHEYAMPITVRQLIHHTSGLRDEFGLLAMAGYRMDDVITKDDILRLIYRQRKLNFEPGSEYLYSNSGYTLLAEITERVTGQSFNEWTRATVFEPLGMHDSHFRDDHSTVIADLAQGYVTSGDDYKMQLVNYASVGASGLYTTALDLALWLQHLGDAAAEGRKIRSLVHTRGILANGDTLDYAFGLAHGQFRGTRRIGHSGSHRGFLTWAGRFPDHDLGIVILSNLEEFNPSDMTNQVAALFIEDETLVDFDGVYYSGELDTRYTLSVREDSLRLQTARGIETTLRRTGRNTFVSPVWYLSEISFKRENGRIAGLSVSYGRTRDVWFTRLDP